MQSMIDNLINGNLSDARRQAKRFSRDKIAEYMITRLGWSVEKAFHATVYLKTGVNFQAYCDSI